MDKNALQKINYGIYIVSSLKNGMYNGQIVNALFQVTPDPVQIIVSLYKKNLTHEYISDIKKFSVSVLSINTPMSFIGRFGFRSGREFDKFEKIGYKISNAGIPIVTENTIAYMDCDVINAIDIGSHTGFIAQIADTGVLSDEKPLSYAYYKEVKGGKTPKGATTYEKNETEIEIKEGNIMDKYKCTVCGYIYNPEEGDPDNGIKPGTSFEDISDDWVCPICGVGKDQFEKVS